MSGIGLTVGEVVRLTTGYLKGHGSDSSRLDAEILTAEAMDLRRLDLYLDPGRPITDKERDALREFVRRRGKGEPIAYITGRREFFGLSLKVSPAVLVPRPETEVLVDATLEWIERQGIPAPLIADVGTGSGAIACAVAYESEPARVIATDISGDALDVAMENARLLGLADRIDFVRCDLLDGLGTETGLDAVVSNPPYVAEGDLDTIEPAVREFEPHAALFAGSDGMSITQRLVEQTPGRLRVGGAMVIEVGTPSQRDSVCGLLGESPDFDDVQELHDAARVVRGFMAIRAG